MSAKSPGPIMPAIGIECHIQLSTKSKLFSAVSNDARGAPTNTLVSHICFGLPGALPVLNRRVVELAIRFAAAVNTRPQTFSLFERKHYFYPDLPKGYQITQLTQPIIRGGWVEFPVADQQRKVRLNRVQIEEDAGKTIHPVGADYSLVDLNRAGTPLFEVVSEPDMTSPEEAAGYARELYLLARYSGVSDADLYHGNMRFDVNVSVSDRPGRLGIRAEIKNLNSLRAVKRAAEYEIGRQSRLLKTGVTINQETRGWDDAKQKTYAQRGKEEAHDYRYMPDPDIPPLHLSESFIREQSADLPLLPADYRRQLSAAGLSLNQIESLLMEPVAMVWLGQLAGGGLAAASLSRVAHWLSGDLQGLVAAGKISWAGIKTSPAALATLAQLVDKGRISPTAAKTIIMRLATAGGDPVKLVASMGLGRLDDPATLERLAEEILVANPTAVSDFRAGRDQAIGFLVGRLMKLSGGQANPVTARAILLRLLET